MTKKKIKKLNVKIEDNFKNDKIVFCFLILSSNKFVEFLLVKFNSFFKKKQKKKKKNLEVNNRIIELTVHTDNYFNLKKELIFEFNKEHLKFKFLYVLLKKKKLSVNFFEKNYLNNLGKEDSLKILNKFILCNLLIKHVFLLKIIFLFYYVVVQIKNNLNFIIFKSILF